MRLNPTRHKLIGSGHPSLEPIRAKPAALIKILLTGISLLALLSCRVTLTDRDNNNDASANGYQSELLVFDSFQQQTTQFNLSESIHFSITLTNLSDDTQVLAFSSEQQYDIYLVDTAFNPIWTWSLDQTLGSTTSNVTLAPNEIISFDVTWNQQDNNGQQVPAGEYQVQALLPVSGEGLNLHFSQQQSEFRSNTVTITLQ